MALPIVPKVEFNFKVIMYLTILFFNSKKLLHCICDCHQNLLESAVIFMFKFRDDCRKKNFFTRKVCHHFFASVNLLMLFASTDHFAGLPECSSFTTKPVILDDLQSREASEAY